MSNALASELEQSTLEEYAEIVAELLPFTGTPSKQQLALEAYVRACELQAERRAIEASAVLAEVMTASAGNGQQIAAAIRAQPLPVGLTGRYSL